MSRGHWAVLLGTFALIVSLGVSVIVGTWLNAMNKRRRAEDEAALAEATRAAKALQAWRRDHPVRAPHSWTAEGEDWLDAVSRAGFPPPVDGPGDDWGPARRHPQA